MPAGLRTFNANGVEIFGVNSSLIRILGDSSQLYTKSNSVYTGSVQNEGLKTGTAWWFIYAVRYQEDTAGDETDLSRVEVTVNRSTGTLNWTAYGYVEVNTLEIRVVYGVR